MLARSWAPVAQVSQERAQVVCCAALKVVQPAERLLGSKSPCRINPELSAAGDVKEV